MRALEDRVAALEKANRRWRGLACAVAAVMALALLTGAKEEAKVRDEIVARQFVVVDDEGNRVGFMSGENPGGESEGPLLLLKTADGPQFFVVGKDRDGGGSLAIQNDKSKVAVRLGDQPGVGGAVTVYAAKGDGQASMRVTEDGSGGEVDVYGAKGNGVASMHATQDGRGAIVIQNDKSKTVVALVDRPGVGGAIAIQNDKSKVVVDLADQPGVGGAVTVYGAKGNGAASMHAKQEGGGLISILNDKSKVVVGMSDRPSGGGMVTVYGANGDGVASMHANEDGDGELLTFSNEGKETGAVGE